MLPKGVDIGLPDLWSLAKPKKKALSHRDSRVTTQHWVGTEFPSPLPLLSKWQPRPAVQRAASRHAVENEKLYVSKFSFHRSHCLLPSAAPKLSKTKYSSEQGKIRRD